MKKINRRKALKNLSIGIGGSTLLSNPLRAFANTKTKTKTIPLKKIGNFSIEKPVTAITLGAVIEEMFMEIMEFNSPKN